MSDVADNDELEQERVSENRNFDTDIVLDAV